MKGYWVCLYEKIYNAEKLKQYAVKAKPAVENFSGKFLVRGGKKRTNEGIESPRIVVVEFANYISALEKTLDKKAKINFLPLQPGDIPDTNANVDNLINKFDYQPSTSVNDGISNFVKWYKDYYEI